MNALVTTNSILEEVLQERTQQDLKWGIQNHPSVETKIPTGPNSHIENKICRFYGIPTEDKAKRDADIAANHGSLTWAHIAVEELSEVISASSEEHRREELIQLSAVCLAWIENIDRKKMEDGKREI